MPSTIIDAAIFPGVFSSDTMVADEERSTGPWKIEWIVLPSPSAVWPAR